MVAFLELPASSHRLILCSQHTPTQSLLAVGSLLLPGGAASSRVRVNSGCVYLCVTNPPDLDASLGW